MQRCTSQYLVIYTHVATTEGEMQRRVAAVRCRKLQPRVLCSVPSRALSQNARSLFSVSPFFSFSSSGFCGVFCRRGRRTQKGRADLTNQRTRTAYHIHTCTCGTQSVIVSFFFVVTITESSGWNFPGIFMTRVVGGTFFSFGGDFFFFFFFFHLGTYVKSGDEKRKGCLDRF